MRSFTSLLAVAAVLFATTTLAFPRGEVNAAALEPWILLRRLWSRSSTCMTNADAQKVADNFKESIANYSAPLALTAFTADFHDYSDSVTELIDNGCPNTPAPLGNATFSSREAFMKGQGSQPPIPFKQLNLWYTCSAVTLRWVSSGSGQQPEQVTGIIVMETAYQNNTWLIKNVYSEFNSAAWLVNLGIYRPSNCSA